MFKAVVVDGGKEERFTKVTILEVNSECKVDVESLRFRELHWVRRVKVDSG